MSGRGVIEQAGGIVVRRERGVAHLLIVSGRRRPHRWVLPKGRIEPGECARDAALREVEEEAGVTGALIAPLGSVLREGSRGLVRVEYFLIEFEREHPTGGEGRRVRWPV